MVSVHPWSVGVNCPCILLLAMKSMQEEFQVAVICGLILIVERQKSVNVDGSENVVKFKRWNILVASNE